MFTWTQSELDYGLKEFGGQSVGYGDPFFEPCISRMTCGLWLVTCDMCFLNIMNVDINIHDKVQDQSSKFITACISLYCEYKRQNIHENMLSGIGLNIKIYTLIEFFYSSIYKNR